MNNLDKIKEKKDKVKETIEPIIKDCFFELVDVEINKNRYLRVIIDKREGKVSIDDCTLLSQKILEIDKLDEIMEGNFTLEVSSPGIDRPLIKKDDFKRFKGNKVKILTKNSIENKNIFIGMLENTDDREITLRCDKRELKIAFDNIKKANLEVDLFQ